MPRLEGCGELFMPVAFETAAARGFLRHTELSFQTELKRRPIRSLGASPSPAH